MKSTISKEKPIKIVRNLQNDKIEYVSLYVNSSDEEETLENQLFEFDSSKVKNILTEDEKEIDQLKVLSFLSEKLAEAMDEYKKSVKKKKDLKQENIEVKEITHQLEA